MKFLLALVIFAVTCTGFAQGSFEAILGYDANNVGLLVSATAGWTFQSSETLNVTSLGCFANVFTNNPGATSVLVGLWAPDGTLLASSSITPTNSLFNQSRYESITPVALPPGQVYHLGVFNATGSLSLDVADPITGGSVFASADIQLDGTALASSGFSSPAGQAGTSGIYAGPNFQYTGGVPEPSSWLLLGLGGLLLVARWRHQRL